MLNSNEIKHIKSLHLKKNRTKYQEFIAEGHKNVLELLNSDLQIKAILATAKWCKENEKLAQKYTLIIKIISDKDLIRISTHQTPNQVLAIVKIPDEDVKNINPSRDLILLLDNIQDPGNMGTIIRTADWFGITHIVCSLNCVDIYNPKVINATMGSIGRVNIIFKDLIALINAFSKIQIFGAVLDGDNVFDISNPANGFIIIGNESNGIHPDLRKKLTHPITIPNFNTSAESLNAAIATGIICAAFRCTKK